MAAANFNDLPRKALHQILSCFGQPEQQKFRAVCKFWKTLVDEDFPLEITINQGNFERLFQCSNASTVVIQNLEIEYAGNVAFGSRVRAVQFSGKVLSSNIFSILRFCPNVEKLSFSSLKQVMGIEGVESVKLPKATTVEIKVRPDQETFTSDEIIIISTLRQIIFGSLESIVVSTGNPYDTFEEEDDDTSEANYNPSEVSDDAGTGSFTMSVVAESSFSRNDSTTSQTESEQESVDPFSLDVVDEAQEQFQQSDGPTSSDAGQQTTPTHTTGNLHVLINRAANFPNASGSDAATTASHASSHSSSRRVRYNISEFEARLFRANLELLVMDDTGSNELNVFNDSVSQTRIESLMYFENPEIPTPAIKHSVFFELVKNNHSTLKNLLMRTRTDFMCFGNLTGFVRDVPKIQFEEIEYSFGRMQMCYEYILLRAQCKLKRLKIQLLDDLWKHVLIAVENSHQTLTDLDIKVMSVSDERADITAIKHCSNLQTLKLLHFFEKDSMSQLPRSLNKLVLNGPLKYQDMESWTSELVEIVELTLLLNTRGDKIDLQLYKKFLKMPKMSKLTLIQCPMDLENIKNYVNHSITSKKGLKFWVSGPDEIREMPSIQYVYTSMKPDQFNRQQIEI